mgnify:CR=1 FL=1
MPLQVHGDDGALLKLLAGSVGAVVSLRFVRGSVFEKVLMVIGGSALSYFGTPFVADYLSMTDAEGLVGFMMGLFGMAIITKVYEVIQVINAERIAQKIQDRLGDGK